MSISLHARHAGSGPPVILLHGLFGTGVNLGGLSRALRDQFSVYSPDLPNHGRSEWLESPTLSALANAVSNWSKQLDLGQMHLVGHSLGGKVAMEIALARPAQVASLTVVDIAPVTYAARHDEVFAALKAVVQARCVSREAAAALMRESLVDEGLVQFLLSSLVRMTDGSMAWRFDLDGIVDGYPLLLAAPGGGRCFAGAAQFIRGSDSDYIQQEHHRAIEAFFPAATLQEIPGAGHWLHAEQADLFNTMVLRFLRSVVAEGAA